MPIDAASFSITPLNPNTYQLTVDFFNNGTKVSNSNPLIFTQATEPEVGSIYDVATFNRSSKSITSKPNDIIKHVIRRNKDDDIEAIRSVRSILPSVGAILESHGLTVTPKKEGIIVVDFSDSKGKYLQEEETKHCQEVLQEYFRGSITQDPETRQALKELYQDSQLSIDDHHQFMIGEGPIKYSLLNLCDPEQKEFLLSQAGKIYHCLFAEFVMNGGKLGYKAEEKGNSAHAFEAQDFIHYTGPLPEEPRFIPMRRSIVFLPPEYKNAYPSPSLATLGAAASSTSAPALVSTEKEGAASSTTETAAISTEGGPFVDAVRRGKICSRIESVYDPTSKFTTLIIEK